MQLKSSGSGEKKTKNENRVENPYMEIDFYAVKHRNTRFYFMFFEFKN